MCAIILDKNNILCIYSQIIIYLCTASFMLYSVTSNCFSCCKCESALFLYHIYFLSHSFKMLLYPCGSFGFVVFRNRVSILLPWNLLFRQGWPWICSCTCLCHHSTGIKGICQNTWLPYGSLKYYLLFGICWSFSMWGVSAFSSTISLTISLNLFFFSPKVLYWHRVFPN